jgi:hypothetical protein
MPYGTPQHIDFHFYLFAERVFGMPDAEKAQTKDERPRRHHHHQH